MIILAIGLLGLASLQAISLKNVNNTQYHTLATIYAYDMVERMRSNKQGVFANEYNNIDAGNCSGSCGAMAQLDASQWNQLISSELPDGSGKVAINGNQHDITVKWREQGRDSSGGTVTDTEFTLSVRI